MTDKRLECGEEEVGNRREERKGEGEDGGDGKNYCTLCRGTRERKPLKTTGSCMDEGGKEGEGTALAWEEYRRMRK